MELKNLLQHIIPTANEQQIDDFIHQNKPDIEKYITGKWDEYNATNNVVEQKIEDIAESPIKQQEKEITTPEESPVQDILNVEPNNEQPTETEETEMATKFNSEKPDKKDANSMRNDALAAQIKNKHITFPNGKVSQEYRCEFNVEVYSPEISEVELTGLDEIGLTFDPEKKLISGVPSQSGDFKIKMKYRFKNQEEGRPALEREITLIINPDPRSLWNNIETPKDIDYYKPDSDQDFVGVTAKKTKGFLGTSIGAKSENRKDMVAASQRGRSHAHEGRPRDDDFGLYFDDESEWYIMVVADGAGSAKSSRKGSEIACHTIINNWKVLARTEENTDENVKKQKHTLKNQLQILEKQVHDFAKENSQEKRKALGDTLYGIIGNAVLKAYNNIKQEADSKGNPIKDYSTTLLLSICKKFEFGWFVGSFWVGDGGIGIYTKDPAYLKVMGEPDGGEFAGQTRFLTMPEIIQPAELYRRLRFDIVSDFTALILMTDGVTDPKFETDANLNNIEKWHNLWNDLSKDIKFTDDNPQTKEQLLLWLDFWSQGNHDDRTIAILF